MKELILSSTIVTGKIYCSKLTNNLLFVCKKVLKQSKKEFFARVGTAIDHGCDGYHRSGDITIDLTAAAIDMRTDLPISFKSVRFISNFFLILLFVELPMICYELPRPYVECSNV